MKLSNVLRGASLSIALISATQILHHDAGVSLHRHGKRHVTCEGSNCANCFGAGSINCNNSNTCYNPTIGQSCCSDGFYCDPGMYCSGTAYCCDNVCIPFESRNPAMANLPLPAPFFQSLTLDKCLSDTGSLASSSAAPSSSRSLAATASSSIPTTTTPPYTATSIRTTTPAAAAPLRHQPANTNLIIAITYNLGILLALF